ncbi:MAG TPA: D-glucuronyl C5-epimerase family protein [Solirubrobacteraceae bacterium]|nr:D-glucuronyl C5-epimerase family protein [Solirubrobacteraceae bacterium]
MAIRRLAAIIVAAVSSVCLAPAGALAARVIVLAPSGHARVENDRFLPVAALTPAGGPLTHAARAYAQPRGKRTPASVLLALRRDGAITPAVYAHDRGDLRQAAGTLSHLSGTRRLELGAVVANLNAIAGAGAMTAGRLPALFLTLERNRQWWGSGPLLGAEERVEFTGSRLVWEYYPGQGIELQELANFGKADGLYTAGKADYPAMVSLLGELIPLAVRRVGGLAWEYYFRFDGGSPPWISAMTEGTAIEALTRAEKATGNSMYLTLAHQILPVLSGGPPVGVSVSTPLGRRFLQYSFAPGASIINAFLQALIGLYDYAHVSGDPVAAQLFAAGNAEAEAEVPRFNTGAWSLYQPGVEDTLSYHQLVTGFLQQLCQRTQAPVYCTTASDFTADLHTPPALTQLTLTAKRRAPFELRFRLSKYSHVGVVVADGAGTVFETSADFPYGADQFTIPALSRAGRYQLRLAATDLAGNFHRVVGTLRVTK